MVEFRQPAEETDVLRRHSRGLSTVGHVSERNGRGRIIHHASSPQTLAVMDGSMFYGSTNLFDENHDMRLDIENMSYEELLALGEQIGNVNTGLSEAAISRCLVESIYYFDQIQDSQKEGRCIICLESYKDGDCVGRLHCRHDFHVCCIKKWLLIKNECPICKASAMETTLVVQ
ncbi:hypothetical protein Cni_G15064 [Canna indica]|uniref:RING-type E3 ubiquitin transferase n=1 Tax=Canna indica TaxID=4628 RepID=A0AAQ3KHC6_9LILI|nr:hypothetical protein Cni_G15064 [Canna indica]